MKRSQVKPNTQRVQKNHIQAVVHVFMCIRLARNQQENPCCLVWHIQKYVSNQATADIRNSCRYWCTKLHPVHMRGIESNEQKMSLL